MGEGLTDFGMGSARQSGVLVEGARFLRVWNDWVAGTNVGASDHGLVSLVVPDFR